METLLFRSARRALVSIALSAAALVAAPSFATPVLFESNTDFSTKPVTFSFDNSSFSFSGTGDYFSPTAVQTAGGGEVSSFGGFLGIPVEPSSDFYPARGSGQISYGPTGTSYAEFTSATTVPYSNGGNVFGLVAMLDGAAHYGFALTSDTTLVSYGFESAANTPIDAIAGIAGASAVPEAATWMMMILGFGLIGGVMRISYRKSGENFTTEVRSLATT